MAPMLSAQVELIEILDPSLINASLPIFDGTDKQNWEHFLNQFKAITDLGKFSPEIKLILLKSHLKKEALMVLETSEQLYLENNYKQFFKMLAGKFSKQPNFLESQQNFLKAKQGISQSMEEFD